MLCLIGQFLHCLHSGKSQRPIGLLRLLEHRCFDGFTQNLSGKNGTTSKHAISLENTLQLLQGGFDEWHVYPIHDLYQGGHQFPYHLICRLVRREQSIPIHLAQRVGSPPRIHSSKVYFTQPFQQAQYTVLYSCGSCHEPLKAFELEAAAAN